MRISLWWVKGLRALGRQPRRSQRTRLVENLSLVGQRVESNWQATTEIAENKISGEPVSQWVKVRFLDG